ncbi:hypothetical protein LCGC14_2416560, partial [marine sediment metagenome]
SGSAYIFKRSGTNWSEQFKWLAADGAEGDWFGISVSISGANAIVGAYFDDDKGADSGSAYIFFRTDSSWSQQQKLTAAADAAAGDQFGSSLSYAYIAGQVTGGLWDLSANLGTFYTIGGTAAGWMLDTEGSILYLYSQNALAGTITTGQWIGTIYTPGVLSADITANGVNAWGVSIGGAKPHLCPRPRGDQDPSGRRGRC